MRRWLPLAILFLAACRKETPATPSAAPEQKQQAVSALDSGRTMTEAATNTVTADSGTTTGRLGCTDTKLTRAEDGGLNGFTGFSGDEKQFAFSTYSEGAGAYLLTFIEAPNKMVNRVTLGGDKEEVAANKLLKDGRFDSDGYVSDFDYKLEGPVVRVLSHGKELWKGEPFGAQGAGNLRVEPWGCSRSRTHGAIGATISSGTEFGDIKAFVIFELPEAH